MSEKIKAHRKLIELREIVAVVCDRCGLRVESDDWIERQEMLRWSMTGGYGSLVGDGERVSLDLCQKCVQEVLGEFLQHHENALDDIVSISPEAL